jgi:SAM-dependent methyltransferase
MPYIGEPYDEDYFHTFSKIRPEGYHDYPSSGIQTLVNIADDIEATTGPVSGKDILDVGCAYGYLTDILTARGANVVGIDLSTWAISQAQSLFPALTFDQGDFLSSPYSNNQFDLTVVCGALECMNNDSEIGSFLSEVRRVTKSRGVYYFLIDYNRGSTPIYQNKTSAEWLADMDSGLPGPFTFNVEDVGHLPLYYSTRVVVT